MEKLVNLDKEFFQLINNAHTPALDVFMYYVGLKLTWIPLYILLAFWVYKKQGVKILLLSLALAAVLILCCDQTASSLVKPFFSRLRPCQPAGAFAGKVHMINDYCGGLYGFVSSHAANFFGLAAFVFLSFRKYSLLWPLAFFITALLVSYSRVYAGVHYPADVLGGAIVGFFWGIITGLVFGKVKEMPFMGETKI